MSGHESKHYPFLTVEELPDFFKALSSYTGSPLVVLAARLLILTGVRTGELRGAFWSEFDLEKAVWEIPAERMKMKRPPSCPPFYPSAGNRTAAQSDDWAISTGIPRAK